MSGAKVVGLLLVILGVVGLLYSGISYTKRENIDLGPVELQRKTTRSVPIPPIAGGVAVIGGVVLLLASGNRQSGDRRAA